MRLLNSLIPSRVRFVVRSTIARSVRTRYPPFGVSRALTVQVEIGDADIGGLIQLGYLDWLKRGEVAAIRDAEPLHQQRDAMLFFLERWHENPATSTKARQRAIDYARHRFGDFDEIELEPYRYARPNRVVRPHDYRAAGGLLRSDDVRIAGQDRDKWNSYPTRLFMSPGVAKNAPLNGSSGGKGGKFAKLTRLSSPTASG